MSNVEQQNLDRKFKLGSVLLDDPAPDMGADEAVRLYENSYPVVAQATLGEPYVEGTNLVYEVIKPAAKTKG